MSPSPRLPKWKKNDIFEAIQGVGLDPREFDLEDDDVEVQLKHKWSKSYFIIGGDAMHYVGRFVVGDAPAWPYDAYSWDTMIRRVREWLEEVKRDLATPDLWAELQREAELLGAASDGVTKNTPFTPDEQKEIAGRLQEMAERVGRTHSLSGPQMKVLNAQLDYLIDAAGRIGRTDWRGLFVGVIVSYILTAALPPESARSIFLTFMTLLRAISHLYGHRLPELPGV